MLYVDDTTCNSIFKIFDIDSLMQKRCNSIAKALELHLFCIKSSL